MQKLIDPWADIIPPSTLAAISARRADPHHPFNFFWGRDPQGRPLLALEISTGHDVTQNTPKIKGFDILFSINKKIGKQDLIIVLREPENKELFYRFCTDIMDATCSLTDETAALNVVLKRIWRWQQFLRQGTTGRLTLAEQKGLIGELTFLETALLPNLKAIKAVECWQGPNGEPKDFVLGSIAVEVKARSTSGRSLVEITSSDQLDKGTLSRLFLYVIELECISVDTKDSFILDDLVQRIRTFLSSANPNALELFEIRLSQAGYFPEDDYSEKRWFLTGTRVFLVEGAFPRIENSNTPVGISDIRYKLDLSACNDHRTPISKLTELLKD